MDRALRGAEVEAVRLTELWAQPGRWSEGEVDPDYANALAGTTRRGLHKIDVLQGWPAVERTSHEEALTEEYARLFLGALRHATDRGCVDLPVDRRYLSWPESPHGRE